MSEAQVIERTTVAPIAHNTQQLYNTKEWTTYMPVSCSVVHLAEQEHLVKQNETAHLAYCVLVHIVRSGQRVSQGLQEGPN